MVIYEQDVYTNCDKNKEYTSFRQALLYAWNKKKNLRSDSTQDLLRVYRIGKLQYSDDGNITRFEYAQPLYAEVSAEDFARSEKNRFKYIFGGRCPRGMVYADDSICIGSAKNNVPLGMLSFDEAIRKILYDDNGFCLAIHHVIYTVYGVYVPIELGIYLFKEHLSFWTLNDIYQNFSDEFYQGMLHSVKEAHLEKLAMDGVQLWVGSSEQDMSWVLGSSFIVPNQLLDVWKCGGLEKVLQAQDFLEDISCMCFYSQEDLPN